RPDDDEKEQRQVGEKLAVVHARQQVRLVRGGADVFDAIDGGSHQRVPSSALARRMFQIMIGSTASMMTTAIADPRPLSKLTNIHLNMRLARTSVFHWPLVMAKMMSNTLRTTMVMVVHTTTMVPQTWGIMMSKKMRKPLAPSMRAASSVSSGTPRRAADRITMANPV